MKKICHYEYAGGEGFLIGIVRKVPKAAKTRADVIVVATCKSKRGVKKTEVSYYTPDEAMAVGLGLIRAVDHVMGKHFMKFRRKMDRK